MVHRDIAKENPAHGMLLAELHGSDFGVFVRVRFNSAVNRFRVRDAVNACLNVWPSLASRVSRNGSDFRAVLEPRARVDEYRSPLTLESKTLSAVAGDDLFRFYRDETGQSVEFLFHHLVVDGDALASFLEDFDGALAGNAPAGSAWNWDDCAASDQTALWNDSGRCGMQSLREKRRPTTETLSAFLLDAETTTRVRAAARANGVPAFALFWAATVEAFSHDFALGTVVSRRMEGKPPEMRGGSFTDVIRVDVPVDEAPHLSMDAVKSHYRRFIAAWAKPSAPAESVPSADLVFSHSVVPKVADFNLINAIELGDYVTKYRHHVQIQEGTGHYAIEVYSELGATEFLDTYVSALAATMSTMGVDIAGTGFPLPLAIVAGEQASPPTTSRERAVEVLTEVLAADGSRLLADLRIDSLTAMHLCGAIEDKFLVITAMDDFYSWEHAADLHRHVKKVSTAPRSHPRDDIPEGPTVHPHLNAIFIDTFVSGHEDMYDVEYAFEVTGVHSLGHLESAVNDVLDGNEIFGQRLAFENGQVVAHPAGVAEKCGTAVIDTIADIRDLAPLRVRQPQRLYTVTAVQWGTKYVLYLKCHHLLMDNISVNLFVEQVGARVHGAPISTTQFSELSDEYETARSSALSLWKSTMGDDRRALVGNRGTPGGSFVVQSFPCAATSADQHGTVLRRVCAVLAEHFDAPTGAIGAAYHGRVVAGMANVIGSFARVLPVYYDTASDDVLDRSLLRARAGQACTLRDLSFLGIETFPVVFQFLGEDDVHSEFATRRIEFEGRTKFGIVVQMVVNSRESNARLEVAVSPDIYGEEEVERIHALFARVFSLTKPVLS